MDLTIGLVVLSLFSVTIGNVIYYQPEAVHLSYGGKTYSKLLIFLLYYFLKGLL